MIYSSEVQHMCPVAKGAYHGPAPIPEEGKWVQVKEIKDISGLTHGVGWCAPQQGACKLTLNVKDGIIEEALVEHSKYYNFAIQVNLSPFLQALTKFLLVHLTYSFLLLGRLIE